MKSRSGLRVVFVILVLVLIGIFVILTPWSISSLSSNPNPVTSYTEAMQRIDALKAKEPADMNPVCHLQILTHGQKVENVIVFIHGYTSCPEQFHDLGEKFYVLGYNVLIAPLPHHGLADIMTEAHALLTAEELVAYADEMVDITQGLGDRVVMMGLSGGANVTAWAAQERADLDLAVIASPAFGFKIVPTPFTAAAMNLYAILPNSFTDLPAPSVLETNPSYSYPRSSRRALAQILRLGFSIVAEAKRKPPAAQEIILVTNGNDSSVNNEMTLKVEQAWLDHGMNLTHYEFSANLGLKHNFIDPNLADQKIDLVYPRLVELIDK